MDSRYLIKNSYPSFKWLEATPTGNGVMGAMVYGRVQDERILVNHERLWFGGQTEELPDFSEYLSKTRELMDQKRYKDADKLYPNLFKEYLANVKTNSFQPGFDIVMELDNSTAFRNYSRVLDMSTGEISVAYEDGDNDIQRKLFVSRISGDILYRIEGSKKNSLNGYFKMTPHDLSDAMKMSGEVLNCEITSECKEKDNGLIFQNHLEGGNKYIAELWLHDYDGRVYAEGDKLYFADCTYITMQCSASVAEKDGEPDLIIRNDVEYYEELLKHIQSHKRIFMSMTLDLKAKEKFRAMTNEQLMLESYNGDVNIALVEKMFHFGRFLLVASSTNCSLPANLQGVWNGHYAPPWSSTFFNNENIQMNYWQALPGNMAEAMLPLFDLCEKLMPDFRKNAQKLYGCKGILPPLFMDNSCGYKKNPQAHVIYWTGSGAWLSQLYYDYYSFTQDERFLKERALPFMYEVALFYKDFMVEGVDGEYISYPSNSPENKPNGICRKDGEISVCINATMDFALLKELLSNLIAGSKKVSLYADKISEWESMLKKIPSYEINSDGAIKEWLHEDFEDNYRHRHLSHIYPLFPGIEIDETDVTLFEACRKAVEKRQVIGLKDQTGWSFAHTANIYARLKDGDAALNCICMLIRFCTGSNLFTYHNDWRGMGVTMPIIWARTAPYQIDANFGLTSAVLEMLLLTKEDKISVLPALPSEWNNGAAKGIRCRGGHIVDLDWDTDSKVSVKIYPYKDQHVTIVCSKASKIKLFDKIYQGENINVDLQKGKSLNIEFIFNDKE